MKLGGESAPQLPVNARLCYDGKDCGEVAERLKALASKASVRETVPWVQIPPSPPEFERSSLSFPGLPRAKQRHPTPSSSNRALLRGCSEWNRQRR